MSSPQEASPSTEKPLGEMYQPAPYKREFPKQQMPTLLASVVPSEEDVAAFQKRTQDLPARGQVPSTTRRFSLFITGTVPGKDPSVERDTVLRTVEKALMGLQVTDGVQILGQAYRSEPLLPESGESAPTSTVPVASDTAAESTEDGPSDGEESSPSSSDGSPSTPPGCIWSGRWRTSPR